MDLPAGLTVCWLYGLQLLLRVGVHSLSCELGGGSTCSAGGELDRSGDLHAAGAKGDANVACLGGSVTSTGVLATVLEGVKFRGGVDIGVPAACR